MDDAAYFQAIPKAELHLHLDGSVRPKTVLELAAQAGVPVPTQVLERPTDYLEATDSTASLVEYITYFELPIEVLQTVVALERATYELCEDLKNDNVRYAEIRYGPWLHVQQGLSLTDVIRAVLSGWTRGRREFGLEGGIIVTALRDMPPAQNLALAQVAGRFVSEGVIGFDLAGDEAGHPPILHEDAFRLARSLGLHITLSREFENAVASVGCSPEQVWAMNLQALEGGFADEVSRARLRHEFVDAEAKLH